MCVRCPLPWPLWMGAVNLRSPSFNFLSSHPPPNLPPLQNQNKKTALAEQCGQAATKASPSLCPHPSSRPLAVWRGQRWSPGVGTVQRLQGTGDRAQLLGPLCQVTAGTICPKRLGLVACRANSGHHPEIQAARSPHQRQGALGAPGVSTPSLDSVPRMGWGKTAENRPWALFLHGPVPCTKEFFEEQMFPTKGPD